MPIALLCGLIDPTDSPATVIRKRASFGLNATALVATIVVVIGEDRANLRYLNLLTLLVSSVFLAAFLVTRHVSPTVLSLNLICFTPVLLALDWIRAAQLGPRMWPCIVVLLDVNLVTSGTTWLPFAILGTTVLWLAIVCLEESFRFGLFDAASFFGGSVVGACDCDDPPCLAGGLLMAFADFVSSSYVLCLDFYFTRRFANSMFAANKSMEASIDTAQSIARALARFDLNKASLHLNTATDLPECLKDAFEEILINLTTYKPYLPEAILTSRFSMQDVSGRDAPGLRNGAAAIVFTDIKSSTATWEAEPMAMKQALRTHNTVVRYSIRQFDGYEVKTIGDSFIGQDTSVLGGLVAKLINMTSFEIICGLIDLSDSPEIVLRKRSSLGLNMGAIMACTTIMIDERANSWFIYLPPFVVSFFFLAHFFVTRRVSHAVLSCNMVCFAPLFLVLDWVRAAHLTSRFWPCMVLLLDVNLVTGGADWLPPCILTLTLLSMVIVGCEESFRFGLFDAVGDIGGRVVAVCDCDDPPCTKGGIFTVFSEFLAMSSILCLDFFFTRRFANSMFAANKSMEASIETAQCIANALARFDLNMASLHLDTAPDLPEGLKDAFEEILLNLTSYKPYLPEAILTSRYSINEGSIQEAPGLRSGVASIRISLAR
ncbi:Adenylate cyclase [Diplonema papillatum]|nr:Adenylate cyclase [Diplonema papillatum]